MTVMRKSAVVGRPAVFYHDNANFSSTLLDRSWRPLAKWSLREYPFPVPTRCLSTLGFGPCLSNGLSSHLPNISCVVLLQKHLRSVLKFASVPIAMRSCVVPLTVTGLISWIWCERCLEVWCSKIKDIWSAGTRDMDKRFGKGGRPVWPWKLPRLCR